MWIVVVGSRLCSGTQSWHFCQTSTEVEHGGLCNSCLQRVPDLLLIQFALWEYQKRFRHPILEILNQSVDSFVGEDIELCNRLLAHHTKHDSRRGDAEALNTAYRTLGFLVHNGMEFMNDLLDSE